MSTERDRRHLVLEGAFNMRDLGGVPTADGYQVKTGKLFRADALHNLTAPDLEVLGAYGIASVVDLRTDDEIGTFGKARLVEHGVRHLHIPLMGDEPLLTRDAELPALGEIYLMMVTKWPDRFVRAVETLSTLENMPSVFHCAAGKDRTGMTAALIYSFLGVEREVIIADYVLTDANMDRILELEKQNAPPRDDDWVEYPASHSRAEAATITTFLDALDEQFGSPVAWLHVNGLSDRSVETLRRELLA